MKKVRECFHMLITAVICLMVSMVPGKNVTAAIAENNAASEILSTRERHVADSCPAENMLSTGSGSMSASRSTRQSPAGTAALRHIKDMRISSVFCREGSRSG